MLRVADAKAALAAAVTRNSRRFRWQSDGETPATVVNGETAQGAKFTTRIPPWRNRSNDASSRLLNRSLAGLARHVLVVVPRGGLGVVRGVLLGSAQKQVLSFAPRKNARLRSEGR